MLVPQRLQLEYSGVGVKAMKTDHRIKQPPSGAFIVIDPWGERLVDAFPTEEAAQNERRTL